MAGQNTLELSATLNGEPTPTSLPQPIVSLFDEARDSVNVWSADHSADNSSDVYTRCNELADALQGALEGLSEEDSRNALLELTQAVRGFASASNQEEDSGRHLAMSLSPIVRTLADRLDANSIPVKSLIELTELSLFAGTDTSQSEHLVEAVYRRCHNNLFSHDSAPDIARNTRFTQALSDYFIHRRLRNNPDADASALASDPDVVSATWLRLMARGFTGVEASEVNLAWGTLTGQAQEGLTASQVSEMTRNNFFENLQRIDDIERQQPGIAVRLFRERGVAHFGRYSEELLLQQFEPLLEGEIPDFVIMAHDDHNGVSYETVKALEQSLGTDGIRNLRIAEASSPDAVVELVRDLAAIYGPAANLIIGAHGREDAVRFGREYVHRKHVDTHLEINRIREQLGGLEEYILEDGTIILISCSAGAKGAIGEQVAQVMERNTQAPILPAGVIGARRENGRLIVDFDVEGRMIDPRDHMGALVLTSRS